MPNLLNYYLDQLVTQVAWLREAVEKVSARIATLSTDISAICSQLEKLGHRVELVEAALRGIEQTLSTQLIFMLVCTAILAITLILCTYWLTRTLYTILDTAVMLYRQYYVQRQQLLEMLSQQVPPGQPPQVVAPQLPQQEVESRLMETLFRERERMQA